MNDEEAARVNSFMKFPYMESFEGYTNLLNKNGFTIVSSEDLNEHYASCVELYIRMLTEQLTFDALKIIGEDMNLFQAMGGEMGYMLQMARSKKLSRGRWIAIKN